MYITNDMLTMPALSMPDETPRPLVLNRTLCASIKIGYGARLVPTEVMAYAEAPIHYTPKAGDVMLGRVSRLGRHNKLHDQHGRRVEIIQGDLVVGVYGNRYATDQYEGYVPDQTRTCQVLSAATVVGVVKSKHSAMTNPTELEVVGLLHNAKGEILNTRDFTPSVLNRAVPARTWRRRMGCGPQVIVVVGASMNSGKTTTVAGIVRGLTQQGYRVGAGKITGTANGGDKWQYADHGAHAALDFSDFGFPSTYLCSESDVLMLFRTLYHTLNQSRPDYLVFEIADGITQRETVMLLGQPELRDSMDYLFYAAGDGLAAEAGVRWLARHGLQVDGLSGLMTASPLATQEAQALTGMRVYTRADLWQAQFLAEWQKAQTA